MRKEAPRPSQPYPSVRSPSHVEHAAAEYAPLIRPLDLFERFSDVCIACDPKPEPQTPIVIAKESEPVMRGHIEMEKTEDQTFAGLGYQFLRRGKDARR